MTQHTIFIQTFWKNKEEKNFKSPFKIYQREFECIKLHTYFSKQ